MKVLRGVVSVLTSFGLTQLFVLGLSTRLSVGEVALAWISVGVLVSAWCTSNLLRSLSDPRLMAILDRPYLQGMDSDRVRAIVLVAYAPAVALLWTAFLFDAALYAYGRLRR